MRDDNKSTSDWWRDYTPQSSDEHRYCDDQSLVMRFQLLDNGELSSGAGVKCTMMLELYLEAELDLDRPHWRHGVDLIDAGEFMRCAKYALTGGRLTPRNYSFCMRSAEAIEKAAKEPKTRWAKLGFILDKPAGVHDPGLFIVAWCLQDGHIDCHVATENRVIECKRIIT